MKKLNILYWVLTGLYAAFIIITSIQGVMSSPESVKVIVTQMGYPAYFLPFLSVAKILGAIAILVPGFPRIKEWAYAGLFFDVIAAMYSFMAMGLKVAEWAPLFLFLAVLGASYYLYHKRQSLTTNTK
ncbi:MAG: DoxX family protein [Chitinophagaceae bacterium]